MWQQHEEDFSMLGLQANVVKMDAFMESEMLAKHLRMFRQAGSWARIREVGGPPRQDESVPKLLPEA